MGPCMGGIMSSLMIPICKCFVRIVALFFGIRESVVRIYLYFGIVLGVQCRLDKLMSLYFTVLFIKSVVRR